MSPTVLRIGPYRFFFFSREEPRTHVHVQSTHGEAKFWLEPEIDLAKSYGLAPHELRRIRDLIEANQSEIRDAWHRHFKT